MFIVLPYQGSRAEQVEIFYDQINIESYSGKTIHEIVLNSAEHGVFDADRPDLKKVSDILKSRTEGSFHHDHVRAKIVYVDEVIYIDEVGGILSSVTGEGRITYANLLQLDVTLQEIVGYEPSFTYGPYPKIEK